MQTQTQMNFGVPFRCPTYMYLTYTVSALKEFGFHKNKINYDFFQKIKWRNTNNDNLQTARVAHWVFRLGF